MCVMKKSEVEGVRLGYMWEVRWQTKSRCSPLLYFLHVNQSNGNDWHAIGKCLQGTEGRARHACPTFRSWAAAANGQRARRLHCCIHRITAPTWPYPGRRIARTFWTMVRREFVAFSSAKMAQQFVTLSAVDLNSRPR